MKINNKVINLTFAIATGLIGLGLSLRLLEISDGAAFTFIGVGLGLTAFIVNSYIQKKKNQTTEKQNINL